jgi:hypothetical protein
VCRRKRQLGLGVRHASEGLHAAHGVRERYPRHGADNAAGEWVDRTRNCRGPCGMR